MILTLLACAMLAGLALIVYLSWSFSPRLTVAGAGLPSLLLAHGAWKIFRDPAKGRGHRGLAAATTTGRDRADLQLVRRARAWLAVLHDLGADGPNDPLFRALTVKGGLRSYPADRKRGKLMRRARSTSGSSTLPSRQACRTSTTRRSPPTPGGSARTPT
ncbi:hypothetical protein LUR56_41045 [Streptomyces sp. MT29]|nr:hypothetical protein [Streptomyces sp. MT29]